MTLPVSLDASLALAETDTGLAGVVDQRIDYGRRRLLPGGILCVGDAQFVERGILGEGRASQGEEVVEAELDVGEDIAG